MRGYFVCHLQRSFEMSYGLSLPTWNLSFFVNIVFSFQLGPGVGIMVLENSPFIIHARIRVCTSCLLDFTLAVLLFVGSSDPLM